MVEFYENNGFIRATVVADNANAEAEAKAIADKAQEDLDAEQARIQKEQEDAQKALDDEYAEKNGGADNANAEGGDGTGGDECAKDAEITGDANKDATSDINALNADLTNAPEPKKSNKKTK